MPAKARIFPISKSAMQSGDAQRGKWKLEFAPEKPIFVDNLMGWNGMTDMTRQISLSFYSKEEAVSYAKAQRIPYEVLMPNRRRLVRKAYADNFAYNKVTG